MTDQGGAAVRADLALVRAGLFDSRARARAAIEAGHVTANGVTVAKASATLAADAVLTAHPAHPWVSRGGVKLAAALDRFGIVPAGRACLDIGTSTGGFAEVLLARGARHVTGVDVGRGQLHPSLRTRADLLLLEARDARDLGSDDFTDAPTLLTIDVSFISLRLVLPHVLPLLAAHAELIALVKPQFEAGRARVSKGVVRDPAVHQEVCTGIEGCVAALGWRVEGVIPSPIVGGDGNVEFLLAATRP